MNTVVVTGAAGFVGMYVVRDFVRAGWEVIAVVHRSRPAELRTLADRGAVTLVAADLTEAGDFERALGEAGVADRAAVLVHCAARVTDVGRDVRFRAANYDAVEHLVHWCLAHTGCRLVHVSTTDVYGCRDGRGRTEEELPYARGRLNPYPKYKIRAERLIRDRLPRRRYVILRPGSIWGVGDRLVAPRIVAFLRNSRFIVCFGRHAGRNRWPLSHVRNVSAAAALAAVDSNVPGQAITVVDPECSRLVDAFRMFAEVYLPGKRLRVLPLPCFVMFPLTVLNEWICRWTDRNVPLFDPTTYTLRLSACDRDYAVDRFVNLLARHGRVPVSRDEGMRELMADRRSGGRLSP